MLLKLYFFQQWKVGVSLFWIYRRIKVKESVWLHQRCNSVTIKETIKVVRMSVANNLKQDLINPVSFLAVPRPTLGHRWKNSHTHPILITLLYFLIWNLRGTFQEALNPKSNQAHNWNLNMQYSNLEWMLYPTVTLSPLLGESYC